MKIKAWNRLACRLLKHELLIATILMLAVQACLTAQIKPSKLEFKATGNSLVTISGYVYDASSRPTSGARVTMIDKVDGLPRSTLTNDRGEFQLSGLIMGRQYLLATSWAGIFSSTELEVPRLPVAAPAASAAAVRAAADSPLIGPIPVVVAPSSPKPGPQKSISHIRVISASGQTKEDLAKLFARIESAGETVHLFLPISDRNSLVIVEGKSTDPPQNFAVQVAQPLDFKSLQDALKRYRSAGKLKGVHVAGGTQFFLVLSLE